MDIQLISIIEKIPHNIGYYLGGKTISRLTAFLTGYKSAQQSTASRPQKGRSFSEWVSYKIFGTSLNPRSMEAILDLISDNEAEAFDQFFLLWNEYISLFDYQTCDNIERPVCVNSPTSVLISLIRDNPNSFFLHPTIYRLKAFINGYSCAHKEINNTIVDDINFSEYSQWLSIRFGLPAVFGWDKIIAYSCSGDNAAFARFFLLLDEWRG